MSDRGRAEHGFAAAEWVVALGLIILPMIMIVGSVAPWLARQTMAEVMTQEAARTVALADDWTSGVEVAEQTIETIAQNYGLETADWEIESIRTEPAGSLLVRGVDVIVEVRVRVPALTVPGIGSVAEVWWPTRHVEHVDDFRSFP